MTYSFQSHPNPTLRLNNIRELLQSHEEDIINPVVSLRNSQNHHSPHYNQPSPRVLRMNCTIRVLLRNLTSHWITALENQLAQLRTEQELEQRARREIPEDLVALGMYNLIYPTAQEPGESALGIPESVELPFPGVECSTLVQLIGNRFRGTNIYRLLPTEKERAESQPTINIGSIEF